VTAARRRKVPAAPLRSQTLARERALLASLQRRVRNLLGADPRSLKQYRAEYERSFESFEGHSSKADLVTEARAADIVFCGDYHTLLQAQKTSIKILREVVGHREVVLALEVVRAKDQRHLDAYMQGTIDEGVFLRRIQYEANWGFPWENYRIFFDFARAHDMRVVALDYKPPPGDPDRLVKRDAFAAQVLARVRKQHPEALVWVVFGDLHVAPAHIPGRLDAILERRGDAIKRMIIYQNNKHLYFRLAEEGQLLHVDTIRLRPGEFCVLNTPPWVRLRTYLDHLETKVFPAYDDDEEADEDENPAYEDFIHQLLEEVGRLVGVTDVDLTDFEFCTRHHISQLEHEVEIPGPEGTWDRLVETAKVHYFPEPQAILLTAFDANHAAEAAGEFLHHKLSGYQVRGRADDDLFYIRALAKTFGFFASLLMNPKRKTNYFKDHDLFLRRWHRRRLTGRRAWQRQVSRLVVQHQRALERIMRAGGGRPRLRRIYQDDQVLVGGVSRALGTIMGDKLFRALLEGRVTDAEVRSWMGSRLQRRHEPYELYLELRLRLKAVKKPYKSKDDFF
jgi:uncharacterized iron-regulated protein